MGKSSLVNAGILPAIRQDWLELGDSTLSVTLLPTMRPGGHPIASLARVIAASFQQKPEDIEKRLKNTTIRLDHLFSKFCDDNTRPLLVIDQFEELFTIADSAEAERLDALLAEAISGEHGLPLLLITTMRSDFLGKLDQLTRLNALRNNSARFEVPPIAENGLREILTQTTLLTGLSYSDPDLPEEIIDEALNEPGALPLVSNLLRLLWEKRGDTSILQRSVYNDVGKLGGALARSADKLLKSLGKERKETTASNNGYTLYPID